MVTSCTNNSFSLYIAKKIDEKAKNQLSRSWLSLFFRYHFNRYYRYCRIEKTPFEKTPCFTTLSLQDLSICEIHKICQNINFKRISSNNLKTINPQRLPKLLQKAVIAKANNYKSYITILPYFAEEMISKTLGLPPLKEHFSQQFDKLIVNSSAQELCEIIRELQKETSSTLSINKITVLLIRLQCYVTRIASVALKLLNNPIIQCIACCVIAVFIFLAYARFQIFIESQDYPLPLLILFVFGMTLFREVYLEEIITKILPFLVKQSVTAINKLNLDHFVEYNNVRKKIDDAKQLWNQQISAAIGCAKQNGLHTTNSQIVSPYEPAKVFL